MNENGVLFQKVTQAYSEKRNPSAPITSRLLNKVPSMPVSLSGIIHHSHYRSMFDNSILHKFGEWCSLDLPQVEFLYYGIDVSNKGEKVNLFYSTSVDSNLICIFVQCYSLLLAYLITC